MLFSQLLLVMLGGPLMVQCQMANGHSVIELAHANPCDDSATDVSPTQVIATSASSPGSFTAEDCVDTSLAQQPVLRQDDRVALDAIPISLDYQVAELPEIPAPAFRASDSLIHLSSPDSAESLARSVILLI